MTLQFVYPIHQLPHNCRAVEEECDGSVCRESVRVVCRESVRGVVLGVCAEKCEGCVQWECVEKCVTVVQLYAEPDCTRTANVNNRESQMASPFTIVKHRILLFHPFQPLFNV